jgi:hypothetical protein
MFNGAFADGIGSGVVEPTFLALTLLPSHEFARP